MGYQNAFWELVGLTELSQLLFEVPHEGYNLGCTGCHSSSFDSPVASILDVAKHLEEFFAELLERGFGLITAKLPPAQWTVTQAELRLSDQHLHVGLGQELPQQLVNLCLLGEEVQSVSQMTCVHHQQSANELL